jgi:hypothetical protein
MVTSACAIAETPEDSATQSASVAPLSPEISPNNSRSLGCEAGERRSADYGSERVLARRAGFTLNVCDGVPCCGLLRAAGSGGPLPFSQVASSPGAVVTTYADLRIEVLGCMNVTVLSADRR